MQWSIILAETCSYEKLHLRAELGRSGIAPWWDAVGRTALAVTPQRPRSAEAASPSISVRFRRVPKPRSLLELVRALLRRARRLGLEGRAGHGRPWREVPIP